LACGFVPVRGPKAIGQARWGTGVWTTAGRGAGVRPRGPVMKIAESTAAQANAAAQIQLIWTKLD
jgi:GH24 family phage-related lysozyme (muramidase)